MAGRILVIRGGAIGDFILTLPAISLLRENYPEAHLEILGYRHIVELARRRHYASETRSIEYGALSRFFIPRSDLPPELMEYFRSFHQVISYLFDPDGSFEQNLLRCGVKHVLIGPGKLDDSAHASQQLARPLERMALYLEDTSARLYPSEVDRAAALSQLGSDSRPIITIHPGSGGKAKVWDVSNWLELIRSVQQRTNARIVIVGGEADALVLASLRHEINVRNVLFLENLPLPTLAAVLERSAIFLGHDSGISHIAAAVGTRCVLLFGPTDPAVWAPTNTAVEVLRAPCGSMHGLSIEHVSARVHEVLETAGIY